MRALSAVVIALHATAAVAQSSPAELDVIEMKDGTIYKGVIVEQADETVKLAITGGEVREIRMEDVKFLSKEKNPAHHDPAMTGIEGGAAMGTVGGAASGQPIIAGAVPGADTSGMPPTMARSGLRLQAELTIAFPGGDIEDDDTSFAPTARVGYEAVYGHLGLGGGLHLRYVPWQLPTEFDRHATTEAHAYGRIAMHVGRTVVFGGISVGIDANNTYISVSSQTRTVTDLGVNLQSGVELGLRKAFALRFGFEYHPPTDTIRENLDTSVSYFALVLGLTVRP